MALAPFPGFTVVISEEQEESKVYDILLKAEVPVCIFHFNKTFDTIVI